jgi:excisionase family DNA binding protein
MRLISDPRTPSEDEAKAAKELCRRLVGLNKSESLSIELPGKRGGRREAVRLPKGAVQLLVEVLEEMGKGNGVTVVPTQAQLTTQEAAELLGVSRPYIVKEIQEGRIAVQMVGTHRRIAMKDLMAYKKACQRMQDSAMDELVRQGQDLGMGY